MTKIRTINDLQDQLDRDFGWRLKELANLKSLINSSDGVARRTAVRAAVCVAYAHWEGFIKESAENYIRFVANQKLKFEELADCFVAIGAKRHISLLPESRKAVVAIAAVEFFRSKMNERPKLSIGDLIRTESNLSSAVFENILISIGFDTALFSSRYHQIDNELVNRRNKIAHGESLDLDSGACRQLIDEVIFLLRSFKTEIENSATIAAYKLKP